MKGRRYSMNYKAWDSLQNTRICQALNMAYLTDGLVK